MAKLPYRLSSFGHFSKITQSPNSLCSLSSTVLKSSESSPYKNRRFSCFQCTYLLHTDSAQVSSQKLLLGHKDSSFQVQSLSNLWKKRIETSGHQIRLYSTSSSNNGSQDDGGQNEAPPDSKNNRLLPRRLVKRLEKMGMSQEEFVAKLNKYKSSNDMSTSPWTPEERRTSDQKRLDSYVSSEEELENLLKSMSTSRRLESDTHDFPSDMKKYKSWEKQEKASKSKPAVDPSMMSVVLFPGQGSQFVGMGKKLLSFPGVRDLYEEASSVLGYDLLHMCLEGPKSELDKTIHCQPAVMITSLAAIEKLREEHPKAIENCAATAGFSVGEFAALVFSGVISFPDAVKVVKVRAQAMQKASEMVGSGMLSVFLAHDSDLKGAMKMAREYCQARRDIEEPVCTVANYLFPECKVIAGHEEALEFIQTNGREFKLLRCKRLTVSGAFHTQLMASARAPLERAFQGVKLGRPKIPIYSNVTSAPYHAKSSFPHLLSKQMVQPVKWEQILHAIYKRPQGTAFPHTYEVGPGKQMGSLLKQVNLQAHNQYHGVEV